MEQTPSLRRGLRFVVVAAWGAMLWPAPSGAQTPPPEPPPQARTEPLRTYQIEKPPQAEERRPFEGSGFAAADLLPNARDRLRVRFGVGYVQGADWGSEFGATGSIGGFQIQLDGLATQGRDGTRLDRGSLLVSDPDSGLRLAVGDVFSPLHGISRGARLSWLARGNRRPSLAVYGPARGGRVDQTVLAYRDQVRFAGQTPIDAEVATDRSWMVRSSWALGAVGLEASYRDRGSRSKDIGALVDFDVWRGVRFSVGYLDSEANREHSLWRSVALRLPVAHWLDLTLERTFSNDPGATATSNAVSAAMGSGRLRAFQRFQWGKTGIALPEYDVTIAREQLQSMATYAAGSRLNLTMQLASAWTATGRVQHWQELQTSVKVSGTTQMQLVAEVPHFTNPDRLRLLLTQQLPSRFALFAEFGRVAAFQSLQPNDRPRGRVMLSRTWDFATPRRGGQVSGYVLDHAGYPIAGARVTLGTFKVTSGADGYYLFHPLPAGEYELALDNDHMPANYAWDGNRVPVSVTHSTRRIAHMRVTPLNAIHGRVFVDDNGNGRFDSGETPAAGVAIRAGDRVMATDEEGAYAFYNLWPGEYVVTLDAKLLPSDLAVAGKDMVAVALGDERPVTGADFAVRAVTKSIVWRKGGGG